MSSIPRCDAASISTTSIDVPLVIATQALQVLSGVGVGPCAQFSAFARIRAIEVLPVPRGPAKRYAWRTCPPAIAFFSVRTTASCPTTSSKSWGRYFRYSAVTARFKQNPSAVPLPICVACGIQYGGPVDRCVICEGPRQWVPDERPSGGRHSRSFGAGTPPTCRRRPRPARHRLHAVVRDRPAGARSLDGVLWDCVPLLDGMAEAAGELRRDRDLAPALLHDHGRVVARLRGHPGLRRRRTTASGSSRPDHASSTGAGRSSTRRRADAAAARRPLRRRAGPARGQRAALGRHPPGRRRPALAELHVVVPESDPAARRNGRADGRAARAVRVDRVYGAWWEGRRPGREGAAVQGVGGALRSPRFSPRRPSSRAARRERRRLRSRPCSSRGRSRRRPARACRRRGR